MPRVARRFLAAAAAILILSPPGVHADTTPLASSASSSPAGFAIVAVDSIRGEWGAAAVSRWMAVGSRSLEARAGAGAWCALELPDPRMGDTLLDRMSQGIPASAALDSLLAQDLRRGERQIAILDRSGRGAAFTGDRCPPWSGQRIGRNYVCQGVGLRDATALLAMGQAFEKATGTLAERLIAAVESAESVFPVREEVESAALLVVRAGGGLNEGSDRLIDLRVDAAQEAIPELRGDYVALAATFLPAAFARFGDEAKRRGDSISADWEYARAEAGFRAAIAKRPKDSDAWNELAWFLATHDLEVGEAVQIAKTAVSMRPRDPMYRDTLAEAEYRSGSLNLAIEEMERAVKYSGGGARYTDRLARWTRERAALLSR